MIQFFNLLNPWYLILSSFVLLLFVLHYFKINLVFFVPPKIFPPSLSQFFHRHFHFTHNSFPTSAFSVLASLTSTFWCLFLPSYLRPINHSVLLTSLLLTSVLLISVLLKSVLITSVLYITGIFTSVLYLPSSTLRDNIFHFSR